MEMKFEKLKIWKLSLEYLDDIYEMISRLPEEERYNLTNQIRRAATSVSLNIAEGSTGQSDREQSRFLGIAYHSAIETMACLRIMERRGYIEKREFKLVDKKAQYLAKKIQAMRNSLTPNKPWLRETEIQYGNDNED